MNFHHLTAAGPVKRLDAKKRDRTLSKLDISTVARHLVTFTPGGSLLPRLLATAKSEVRQLAELEAVQNVATHNPDSIWAIARRGKYSASDPVAEGFIAFLFLNSEGTRALFNDSLNRADPDLSLLCGQHEKPASIYIWHLHARGKLAPGVALAFQKISSPQYSDVDIVTRPITSDGAMFTDVLGFTPGAVFERNVRSDLFTFPRNPETLSRLAPSYDSFRPDNPTNSVSVTVARSLDDLTKVASVRTAVYIDEQHCPYEEEFDGNDFVGLHLLGYVGQEPVGCMRIRFFGDYAKCERMAVRKEFRRTRLSDRLIRAAIEICRAKGFPKIYAHVQARLERFWGRYGFTRTTNGKPFAFSDYSYREMELLIGRDDLIIGDGTDPYVTIRPEGRWHQPGVLERSLDNSKC
jgi:predicted GNAT family N-acyltransferase